MHPIDDLAAPALVVGLVLAVLATTYAAVKQRMQLRRAEAAEKLAWREYFASRAESPATRLR